MTTPTRTRSQIGRSSRDKGARFERAVATAVRPWFPDARRSRDNGSSTTADTGDLAGTHDRLWWSLKDDRKGISSPPGLIAAWLAEAAEKAGSGRVPLLVQKRGGHPALRSWCWLWLDDLTWLAACDRGAATAAPVRLELGHVLDLLAARGLAAAPDLTTTTTEDR